MGALEPMERRAAEKRMKAGKPSENFTEGGTDKAETLTRVAATVGMSRPTLAKATEVVEAAKDDPKGYGDLVTQTHQRKIGQDPVKPILAFFFARNFYDPAWRHRRGRQKPTANSEVGLIIY